MVSQYTSDPLFSPGIIVITRHLHEHALKCHLDLQPYLLRHLNADWGELCQEDTEINNQVLENGLKTGRLFSSYCLNPPLESHQGVQEKIWIVTHIADYEPDGSPVITTTVMFPSDY